MGLNHRGNDWPCPIKMNAGMKNHTIRRLKLIVLTTAALGLAATIGANALVRNAASGRTYSDVSSIPYRRVGVLLGCPPRLSKGGTNLFFGHRIAAAVQLLKAHKIDYVIASGDKNVLGCDEPTAMKRSLVDAGVPAERVYCDFGGFRTLESVMRAKEVYGQTNVTIISQNFHNQRAIYIARGAGIDAIGFNATDVDSYGSFLTRLRELFARVRSVPDVRLLGMRPRFAGPGIEIGGSEKDQTKGDSKTTVSPATI